MRDNLSQLVDHFQGAIPEIETNIAEAWTETGIVLSRSRARPHENDQGRDVIRNWTQRYPHSVNKAFLPMADRFVRSVTKNQPSSSQSRVEMLAKLAALRELIGDKKSASIQKAGLKADHTYCLALIDLSNDERVLGCMTVRFEDDATGTFHMFRFDRQLYDRAREYYLKESTCFSLGFKAEQVELFAHGLCSVRHGVRLQNGKSGRIELDALYSHVIETSTVGASEFWFSTPGMNAALGRFSFDYKFKRKIDQSSYSRNEISVYAGVFYKDQKDQYGDRLRLANFPISNDQLRSLEVLSGYSD